MDTLTLVVVSAYARLAAAAIDSFSFAAVFFLRSSSSWISFIVFFAAAGAFAAFVHTAGTADAGAGEPADAPSFAAELA